MSYSFSVNVDTRDAARAAVDQKFQEIIDAQPSHDKDRSAVLTAACAFVDLLRDPGDGEGVYVAVGGYLDPDREDPDKSVTGAVSIVARIQRK